MRYINSTNTAKNPGTTAGTSAKTDGQELAETDFRKLNRNHARKKYVLKQSSNNGNKTPQAAATKTDKRKRKENSRDRH